MDNEAEEPQATQIAQLLEEEDKKIAQLDLEIAALQARWAELEEMSRQ